MEMIHAHEVIEVLVEQSEPKSMNDLINVVTNEFGTETKYFNCQIEGATAKDLLEFLASSGQLKETNGKFQFTFHSCGCAH